MSIKGVGFDLDGVIIDFSETKRNIAGGFGIDIRLEDTPSEIFRDIVPAPVFEAVQAKIYAEHDLDNPTRIMAGAREVLEELRVSDSSYFLISRRRLPEVAIATLKYHDLWPGIFNQNNSFFVRSPEEKNDIATKLGVDLYFDDESAVLEKMFSVPHRFIFDQFGIFSGVKKFPRVDSWEKISSTINSLR